MSDINPYTGEIVAERNDLHEKKTSFGVIDEHGRLMPDPTPLDPPIGYRRQPSLAEQIRDMVRSEQLRQAADAAGLESFEESDDFEVGDDFDPASPYEADFDTPVAELKERQRAEEAAKVEPSQDGAPAPLSEPPEPLPRPAKPDPKRPAKAAPPLPLEDHIAKLT